MPLGHRLARLAAAGIVAPLLAVAAATAASAHGAPLDPVSRSAGCGSEGQFTQTAACRAARAGDEGQWFEQWDNVRVANVNGRDREVIPDGKLCSGGIAQFGGLDLARSDWPSTTLQAGKAITVSYRGTIPHAGTFRMYVTRDGYSPKRALRWADLETKPFLTAQDPAFASGAYSFKGTLPSGKVGHHVLFTIWQNSSTADTYYSCSDVLFAAPAGTGAKPAAVVSKPAATPTAKPESPATTVKGAPGAKRSSPAGEPSTSAVSASPAGNRAGAKTGTQVSLGAAENVSDEVGGDSLLIPALGAVGLLALAGTGGTVVMARRSRRPPRRKRRH